LSGSGASYRFRSSALIPSTIQDRKPGGPKCFRAGPISNCQSLPLLTKHQRRGDLDPGTAFKFRSKRQLRYWRQRSSHCGAVAVPGHAVALEHLPPFGRHALAANNNNDHENHGKYPGGNTNFGC
jgi:hypothetical protein